MISPRTITARALAALPAVPVILLGMSNEYWGRVYLLWGVVFLLLNCRAMAMTLRRCANEHVPSTWRLFWRQMLAWSLSVLALAVINLTPLCLGQNNGDGRNSLVMCIMLTVLWPGFMSLCVIPAAYGTAVGAHRLLLGKGPEIGTCAHRTSSAETSFRGGSTAGPR
jgi:hypothetical protein